MRYIVKYIIARLAARIKGWRDCIDECKRKKIIDLGRGNREKEPHL